MNDQLIVLKRWKTVLGSCSVRLTVITACALTSLRFVTVFVTVKTVVTKLTVVCAASLCFLCSFPQKLRTFTVIRTDVHNAHMRYLSTIYV